jgi:hypothetical protein
MLFPKKQAVKGLFKKVPYSVLPSNLSFVLPSDSEVSLTCARDGVPRFVRDGVPGCHPEARKRRGTPRLTPLGDMKGGVRGGKKVGSGRQQEGLHKNIFSTAPAMKV